MSIENNIKESISEAASGIFLPLEQIDLISIGIVVFAAWLIVFLGQRVLTWIAEKLSGRLRLYTLSSVSVLRMLVIITSIALLIPRLIEPTFENLIAMMSAAGLALGFALKDYVSSVLAGVVILYELPFRPGDWISIDGNYGEVKAVNLRTTDILTQNDDLISIPNIKLWNTLIHNANDGGEHLQCAADFIVHPDSDLKAVREKLFDVALTSPYLQLKKPVTVGILNKKQGTQCTIRAYPVDVRQQFRFKTDMTIRGNDSLKNMGVTMMTAPYLSDL